MVSALKLNNNDKPVLESLIEKFSGEAKQKYYIEENRVSSPFVDRSVQKLAVNSIIEGYFPKEH